MQVEAKTSYLFKVARGLAFASSQSVEEEPCLGVSGVSFDKEKRKKTNVRSFFSKRTIHSLTHFFSFTHSLLNNLFHPLIPLITHSLDQSITQSINISAHIHSPENLNIATNPEK